MKVVYRARKPILKEPIRVYRRNNIFERCSMGENRHCRRRSGGGRCRQRLFLGAR